MTDKIVQAIYESATDDIVLVRTFPPGGSGRAPSYFGGLPRLPDGLNWPYSDYIGRHVSFLAQIDLASLPAIQWRSRLPAQGTLFFFVNTAFDRYEPKKDKWGHVLFAPQACIDLEERQAPSDLMPIHGDSIAYTVKWLAHDHRDSPAAPRLFPCWPVEARIVRTFSTLAPNEEIREAREVEERRVLDEAFGKPTPKHFIGKYHVAADGGPSRLGPPPPPGYPLKPIVYGAPWLPDEGWPYSWIFAAIFCAQLENNLHHYLKQPEPFEERARSWRNRADTAGLFTAMPDGARHEFRNWIRSIPLTSVPSGPKGESLGPSHEYGWIQQSLSSGIDACLGYARDAKDLFPAELLPLIEDRHRPYRGDDASYGFVRHQLLGAPRAVQTAVEEYGATHILLAQFDHDPGCLWHWGDTGVLQFWITRQDLAALRFDRAIMTMEGG
jgi:uncharacterized protein YwqG